MTINWTPTSQALPPDGRDVEFILERRPMAMTGTYHHGLFASRWSTYAAAAVLEWRDTQAQSVLADAQWVHGAGRPDS